MRLATVISAFATAGICEVSGKKTSAKAKKSAKIANFDNEGDDGVDEEPLPKDPAVADHPKVTWGQYPDKLRINIYLKDVESKKVESNSTHVHFEGRAGGLYYDLYFPLLRPIVSNTTRIASSKYNHVGEISSQNRNFGHIWSPEGVCE